DDGLLRLAPLTVPAGGAVGGEIGLDETVPDREPEAAGQTGLGVERHVEGLDVVGAAGEPLDEGGGLAVATGATEHRQRGARLERGEDPGGDVCRPAGAWKWPTNPPPQATHALIMAEARCARSAFR